MKKKYDLHFDSYLCKRNRLLTKQTEEEWNSIVTYKDKVPYTLKFNEKQEVRAEIKRQRLKQKCYLKNEIAEILKYKYF